MYKLKEAKQIDIATEINAMVAFLSTRWTNIDNVAELFRLVADAAVKNTESALTDHTLSIFLLETGQRRRKVLESFTSDAAMLSLYDQVGLLFDSLDGAVRKVHSTGNEMLYDAYKDTFDGFKKALKGENLAQLKKAAPIGLREMTKHYQENDKAWDKALHDEFTDRNLFTGADTGTGSDGGFVSLVSLISVVQQKDRHNTSMIDILLHAAYTHFIRVCMHNNTQAIIADLDQLLPLVEVKQPVFKVEFNPEHKLTKVMLALARESWRGIESEDPEKDYLESVEDRKNQKPLSPEEKAANRAAAVAEISAMFKSVLKPESAKAAKEREKRNAREQQQVRDLLKNVS